MPTSSTDIAFGGGKFISCVSHRLLLAAANRHPAQSMHSWVSLISFCTPFPLNSSFYARCPFHPSRTHHHPAVFPLSRLPILIPDCYRLLYIIVLAFPAIQTLTTFFSGLFRTVSLARYHYGRPHLDIIPHSFQFHTIFSFIFSDVYHTLSITYLLHSLSCTFILALYLDWRVDITSFTNDYGTYYFG